MPLEDLRLFHVQLTKGSGFSVKTAAIWDLDPIQLEEAVIGPRREGRPIWRAGVEFPWPETQVQVYSGPRRREADPQESELLGPPLLAMGGKLRVVTDDWITGPAGVFVPLPQPASGSDTDGIRRFQVFLSSTFVDLEQERVAVTQALLRTNRCIPAGMELFTASSLPPWDVITRVLDLTDYFVLILGHRYGSSPPEGGPSYTEREYDYAVERGIPVLAFTTDPTRPTDPTHLEPEDAKRKALKAFRDRIQAARTVKTWNNLPGLEAAVITALYSAFYDTPRPGWVRGREPT